MTMPRARFVSYRGRRSQQIGGTTADGASIEASLSGNPSSSPEKKRWFWSPRHSGVRTPLHAPSFHVEESTDTSSQEQQQQQQQQLIPVVSPSPLPQKSRIATTTTPVSTDTTTATANMKGRYRLNRSPVEILPSKDAATDATSPGHHGNHNNTESKDSDEMGDTTKLNTVGIPLRSSSSSSSKSTSSSEDTASSPTTPTERTGSSPTFWPRSMTTPTTTTTTRSDMGEDPASTEFLGASHNPNVNTSILSTTSAMSGASSTNTNHTSLSHWDFCQRWNEFSARRLQLSRQRVSLEQRLFEIAELKRRRGHDPTAWQPLEEASSSQGGGGSSPSSSVSGVLPQEFPTLASMRWEQVDFPDGQIYEGQVLVLLKRHVVHSPPNATSRRVFRKKEGESRISTTTEWIRHGHGCNRWPDGQVYRGSWVYNSRQGRGTHTWPDGRTVTGGWLAGHLHGRIFFCWPDGSTYDGDAVAGKKHGRGVHSWGDGSRVYVGQYHAGCEHGLGSLTESDSDGRVLCKYRGQLHSGKRHGYGVQIWQDKTYDGEWVANSVHGKGKLTWHTTGACYTGEFREGRYHGKGCLQTTRRTYVGDWQRGVPHGTGHESLSTGTHYMGGYEHGYRHGFGRCIYPDSRIYIGQWKRGRRSGLGILLDSDHSCHHVGLWKQHEPHIAIHPRVQDDSNVAKRRSTDAHLLDVTANGGTRAWSKDTESIRIENPDSMSLLSDDDEDDAMDIDPRDPDDDYPWDNDS